MSMLPDNLKTFYCVMCDKVINEKVVIPDETTTLESLEKELNETFEFHF